MMSARLCFAAFSIAPGSTHQVRDTLAASAATMAMMVRPDNSECSFFIEFSLFVNAG
jgi:hypothetical protein